MERTSIVDATSERYKIYKPLVSIIVPIYKTATYLPQCIDSILLQKFKNFELLLIDDGSPDDSPKICDQYARKDARVHVVHKINGGVSSARNVGIDLAVGKYIVFIDSDDYVGEDYLSDMVDVAQRWKVEEKSVLVITDYQPFSESGVEERMYPSAFTTNIAFGGMTGEQFRNLVFGFRVFPPYCKLYCKSVIDKMKLRFNTELKSAEDFDFNNRYMENIKQVCYVPSIQYYYRVEYKKYVPSNHGVLGQSEIKSVHIMAHGIIGLAKRVGIYKELEKEICLWAANKQYFNRLPMLFAESKEVGMIERYKLYHQLIGDSEYNRVYKQGVRLTAKSTTRWIGSYFDCFFCWWLFYRLTKLR